jgi:pimeloyl-ACP methyl ester carboxylesterase
VPQLSEWAEVATFDAPGVGDEPIPDDDLTRLNRALVVQRALQEVERLEWDSYFVVGDAWGTATAVLVAAARPAPVLGLALGHASLNYETGGQQPAVNGELAAAMTQLLRTDYDSFVRYGITQFTQGGFDEETTARMVARFPRANIAAQIWEMHVREAEPVGRLLAALRKPLLLAKHDGCLVSRPRDTTARLLLFPTRVSPASRRRRRASDEFADALRDYCEARDRSFGRQPTMSAL